MWTERRRNHFLLVRIKASGRVNIIIPLSLVVFEQIFTSFYELVSFVKDVLPARYLRVPMGKGRKELSIGEILELLWKFWVEMRSYGRWKMVDIESEDARVEIRFI